MNKTKVRSVGNSLGITIPKEVIAKLRVAKGDELFIQETPDGVRLTAYDPFEKQLEAARNVMQRRRNVLRSLAK